MGQQNNLRKATQFQVVCSSLLFVSSMCRYLYIYIEIQIFIEILFKGLSKFFDLILTHLDFFEVILKRKLKNCERKLKKYIICYNRLLTPRILLHPTFLILINKVANSESLVSISPVSMT